jgi:hypothetical protein
MAVWGIVVHLSELKILYLTQTVVLAPPEVVHCSRLVNVFRNLQSASPTICASHSSVFKSPKFGEEVCGIGQRA